MLNVPKGWRDREKAGLARSRRALVSPEIRAIRAAHLEAAEKAAAEAVMVRTTRSEIDAEVEARVAAVLAAKAEVEAAQKAAEADAAAAEGDAPAAPVKAAEEAPKAPAKPARKKA